MNILEIIKNDDSLVKNFKHFFDIELLENKQVFSGGSSKYNIEGTIIFMSSSDSSNNFKYILLDDNSVAFCDADYGTGGRIAESINEFFEMLISIPEWKKFTYLGLYRDDKLLNKYIKKVESKSKYRSSEYKEFQNELFKKLSINFIDKIQLLKKFYFSATREPKWTVTYFDGNKGWISEEQQILSSESKGWVTEELILIDMNIIENKKEERKFLGL